jgi:predicted dehydrogenase
MDEITIGVVGVGRGLQLARQAADGLGVRVVAICDTWQERLVAVEAETGISVYTDTAAFLRHEMDAVVLANYFHEHADLAVAALAAGRHVLSEIAACMTLGEAVRLVEAVEASDRIYMIAENYPYMLPNQTMRELYRSGRIGKFVYGEGEYVHPMSGQVLNSISVGYDHWRNWLPVTYYSSHALAPLMYITDESPVAVSGFAVPHDAADPQKAQTVRRMDTASVIIAQMESGALVKLLQYDLRGEGNWVRVHGNAGLMENLRFGDRDMVRLRRERFDKDPGEPVELVFKPDFPSDHDAALGSGHGGSDYFVFADFKRAVHSGQQPYLDVYRGVTMAAVGIEAYRSALDGSRMRSLPDLRDPAQRDRHRHDEWTPDPARRGLEGPSPSVLGDIEPSEAARRAARQVWDDYDLRVTRGHSTGTL